MNDFLYKVDWTKMHILKCYTKEVSTDQTPLSKEKLEYKHSAGVEGNISEEHEKLEQEGWLIENLRSEIEPWLTSIFQSDNISLLAGTGLTAAVTAIADTENRGMSSVNFEGVAYKDLIDDYAKKIAKESKRGEANIEDVFNAAFKLLEGFEIIGETEKSKALLNEINNLLSVFIQDISKAETFFFEKRNDDNGIQALRHLQSFLISFSARTASRERLNIFTTNYDRFIEYGLDTAGILSIDRFVGKIHPKLRTTKLDLDYHYNPPGIRGEPRYVEGVVRLTKLHGSIDWKFEDNDVIRVNFPFGQTIPDDYFYKHGDQKENVAKEHIVIYPNSSKGVDTTLFPYTELFRDFSSAVCKPNSVIVTYGYGFGDSHINRIISDMLSLPSTHLVIIGFNSKGKEGEFDPSRERIKRFCQSCNPDQLTLLLGSHFGHLPNLVNHYLPKAAIDRIQSKALKIQDERYGSGNQSSKGLNYEK